MLNINILAMKKPPEGGFGGPGRNRLGPRMSDPISRPYFSCEAHMDLVAPVKNHSAPSYYS